MSRKRVGRVAAQSVAAGLAVALSSFPFGTAAPAGAQSQAPGAYEVTSIFSPAGLTTGQGYPLSKPDDIVEAQGNLFVAFQNGVGSTGSAAPNGNTDSSIVELTLAGRLIRQWNLTGKIDGLGVDPATMSILATVNEDGNSSIYTVDPSAGGPGVTHYCYDQKPLPHGGGTDSIAAYDGKLIVSASAPNPAPANVPAVYALTLQPGVQPTNCPGASSAATGTAVLTPGFSDTAASAPANAGAPSTLALTDPDSSTVVPHSAPRFGGAFLLDSQGDDQQIYTTDPMGGAPLDVLQLSQSVNDTAFIDAGDGALYVTDASANAVDRVTGPFRVGQAFVAATPCGDNNAPSSCPAPPTWPANYLGQLDTTSGQITSVSTALEPQGMIFVAGQGRDR
jgi:hypothetical protein